MANASSITLAQIEGDFVAAVKDAQNILALLETVQALIPAGDRQYVTDAQNIVTVLSSIASKLSV